MKKLFIILYSGVGLLALGLMIGIAGLPPQFISKAEEENYVSEFVYGTIVGFTAEPVSEERVAQIQPLKQKTAETIFAKTQTWENLNTYKIGDRVQVYKQTHRESGEVRYEIADFYHQDGLLWIFGMFVFLALFVARKKGFTAIVSVIVSLGLFYFLFLKLILAGVSPLTAGMIFIFFTTVLTIPLIHGLNKKSLAATISIFLGYGISFAFVLLFKNLVQLGVSPDEEFRMLGGIYPEINLSEILLVSLFLGAVGALIDTAISIASPIFEAVDTKTPKTMKEVFFIGIEVGKDILGSMINTLLFAYIASSLPFFIILSMNQSNTMRELINMDFIALELTRTCVGAISLVIIIPISAAFSAYFFAQKK